MPINYSRNSLRISAIVKYRTSYPGQLGVLHILSVSPFGEKLTVVLHPPPSNEPIKLDLPFDPPMKDPYAVRRTLYQWRDEANRHFSVVRALSRTVEGADSRTARDSKSGLLFPTCTLSLRPPPFSQLDCFGLRELWERSLCGSLSRVYCEVRRAMVITVGECFLSLYGQLNTALVIIEFLPILISWLSAFGGRTGVHVFSHAEIQRSVWLGCARPQELACATN